MLDFSDTVPEKTQDDTPELRRWLNCMLETWIPRLLPGAVERMGAFHVGSTAGERGKSLQIQLTGERRGLWHDHATGEGGDSFDLLQSCLGVDFPGACKTVRDMMGIQLPVTKRVFNDQGQPKPRDRRKVNEILLGCVSAPKRNDAARSYLRGRGITLPIPRDILSHYHLPHPATEGKYVAMIGAVRQVTGRVTGLHRTYLYLNDEGFVKHPSLSPVKAMLGECGGGAVRLTPDRDSPELAVCEGIETGLSVLQLGLWEGPLWAALSTSGLRALLIPAHVTRVAIFADMDPPLREGAFKGRRPGTIAAEAMADRLTTVGRSVRIVYPEKGFGDFNDQLLGKGTQ